MSSGGGRFDHRHVPRTRVLQQQYSTDPGGAGGRLKIACSVLSYTIVHFLFLGAVLEDMQKKRYK